MNTIKKDSAIITAACKDSNTELWLSAKKIINFLVFKLQNWELQKDKQWRYKVYLKEIKKHLKLSKNKAVREGMLQLQNLQLIYDQSNKHKEEWTAFSFLRMLKYKGQNWKKKFYKFKMEKLLEKFIKRPFVYAKLHLEMTSNFQNKYTVNFYEIAKDILPVSKKKREIDEFRKLIGCGYKNNITVFFKNVVDLAIEEVNNQTEISISYKKIKEWRSYKYIQLKFSYKNFDIRKKLISDYKINEHVVDQIMIKYMNDREILKEQMKRIKFDRKQGKVKKLGWYTYSRLIKANLTELREKKEKEKKRKEEQKKMMNSKTSWVSDETKKYINEVREKIKNK